MHSGVTYAFGHIGYKQVNLSGTSQAGPQIAGISALYLQNNPNKKFLSPKDFSNIVKDLLKPHWNHANGAIIDINGGVY